MTKAVLVQIFLFFVIVSSGFTQDISFDSLNRYYHNELEKTGEWESDKEGLIEKIEGFSVSEVSKFSEFQGTMEMLALIDRNSEYQAATKFISQIIPKAKSVIAIQAFLYFKLAQFHSKLSQPIQALESYLRASSLVKKLESFSYLSHIYYKISIINLSGLNNEIGIQYADKGLQTLKEIEKYNTMDSASMLGLYEVKGIAFRRTHQFEKALFNIEKALEMCIALNDSVRLALNNGNKATIYYENGDYELAIPLLEEDFRTSINARVYNSGMNALIYLSWIYLETGDFESLLDTFAKMQEIEEKYPVTNPRSKAEYYKVGANVAEINGDTSKANQYLRNYILNDKIRDSINHSNDVANLHERHLMEQEISKLELLQNANELQASHLKLRTALLIIIAIALLVVLWYVFTLRNKNKKIDKLNEMLEAKVSERTARLLEINKELDTYLYRASHDIRRPIRTLLGLNNIAQIDTDPEQMKQLFSKVHSTAMSMDKMLFKLQMAYELNNTHDIEKVEIKELTKESLADMSLEIKEHKAHISVNIKDEATTIKANKALLRIALDNILENALLYQSSEKHDIEICTDIGNYFFYIHVKDNGFGIPEKHLTELFKPYFKISNKTQGSGLGLFLAHKAISFLAGEISVTSKVNQGSQFTIKIPINPK